MACISAMRCSRSPMCASAMRFTSRLGRPRSRQRAKQSADFRNRKPEPARPPDETELVDVAFAVVAIGVAAALRGAQQADRLVMADHLRIDAARRRRRADIHVENPLDLPMIGRFRPPLGRRQGDLPMSLADAKSALAKDPVCGMSVDPASAKHKAEHAGATYYFCSGGCREKFVAEPARFLPASTRARRRQNPRPRARSTPARCIRKSARTAPALARSAAWRWSRKSPPRPTARARNSPT